MTNIIDLINECAAAYDNFLNSDAEGSVFDDPDAASAQRALIAFILRNYKNTGEHDEDGENIFVDNI